MTIDSTTDLRLIATVTAEPDGAILVNPATVRALGHEGTRRVLLRALAAHGPQERLLAQELSAAVRDVYRAGERPQSATVCFFAEDRECTR